MGKVGFRAGFHHRDPRVSLRSAWQLDAACAGQDPDLWVLRQRVYESPEYRLAERICLGCPVRRQCLVDAAALGDWGVIRAGWRVHGPVELADCVDCGEEFVRRRAHHPQRYCGNDCRQIGRQASPASAVAS